MNPSKGLMIIYYYGLKKSYICSSGITKKTLTSLQDDEDFGWLGFRISGTSSPIVMLPCCTVHHTVL